MSLKSCICQTEATCFVEVSKNWKNLRYSKFHTEVICMEALKQHWKAFTLIKKQTPKLCLEAVRKNGALLPFVKEQSEEICLEAVRREPEMLAYVIHKTRKICLTAVEGSGSALQEVPEELRDEMILTTAITNDPSAIYYVKNPSRKLCLLALRIAPYSALKSIHNPTNEYKRIAISRDPSVIGLSQFSYNKITFTKKQYLKALKIDGINFGFLPKKQQEDQDLINTAIASNGSAIQFVTYPTPEQLETAIRRTPLAIEYIEKPSKELQELAVEGNSVALTYINNLDLNASIDLVIKAVKKNYSLISFIKRKLNYSSLKKYCSAGLPVEGLGLKSEEFLSLYTAGVLKEKDLPAELIEVVTLPVKGDHSTEGIII